MLRKIADKRNYIILFIIIILSLFIFWHKDVEHLKTFYYFDETLTYKIYTNKNTDKIFKDIDKIYQKFNNKSNREYINLLKYGKSLYKKSQGLIDISSGKLLEKIQNGEAYKFATKINELNFEDEKTLKDLRIICRKIISINILSI